MSIIRQYLKGDFVIWIAFGLLCLLSAVEAFSATSSLAFKSASHTAPMFRHAMFLLGGVATVIVVHLINYKHIRMLAYLLLILSIGLLLYNFFGGGLTINGATRWVRVFGFSFQPSELAKFSLIIVLADLIDRMSLPNAPLDKIFKLMFGLVALICGLILKEDFSTAMILFFVLLLMMCIGEVPFKKIGTVLVFVFLFCATIYGATKVIPKDSQPALFHRVATWENRIKNFAVDNDEDAKYKITDNNRQIIHGKIAIARGGLFGVMPGNSVERDFLPEAYSDYIYAIVVEELGMIGGIFVIMLYLIVIFRAGRIAMQCDTLFPMLTVIGLALMIVLQAFVSMGVTVHLGPVTGQPLPMISRGGTTTIITSIYFGVILGISRYTDKARNPELVLDEVEANKVKEESDEEIT